MALTTGCIFCPFRVLGRCVSPASYRRAGPQKNETRDWMSRVSGKSHACCVLSPSLPYSVVTGPAIQNGPATRIVTPIDIKNNRGFLRDPLDAGTQRAKALVYALVATIDELDVLNLAAAGCHE